MVRLSLAIALVTTFLATGMAAPANPGKSAQVIPFARAKSTPNWKQAVSSDKARIAHFVNKSKVNVDSSSVGVENEDFSYVASVGVGSQTFSLIVDTGSSNTWVGAGTKYSPGSTSKSTGDSVSVSYGSGSFSGKEYTDTVTLGSLTITSQSIGDATTASGFSGVDGIIGKVARL